MHKCFATVSLAVLASVVVSGAPQTSAPQAGAPQARAPKPAATQLSAADLLAKVVASQDTRGFTMRARVVLETRGAAQPTTIQIRALGKRTGNLTRVLYQALWPDKIKGQAVIVEKPDHRTTQGMFYTPPDTMTPITAAKLTDHILGTDMTVEDLSEEFYWWPNPVFAGDDKVGKDACRIIELHAPAGSHSSYPTIRTCVSVSKLVVLRIEKMRADGRVAKRFVVTRTARTPDGSTAPRNIEIENLERGSKTTIEVTRGDRDFIAVAADFSLEKLKSLGR